MLPAPMVSGNRKFRPGRWATAGTVVAAALLAKAGLWQLDRADQRRAILAQYHERSIEAAHDGPLTDKEAEASRYAVVKLRGRFDSGRQFLMDNVVHRGRVGYQVLTPFLIEDGGGWIIVNRGWRPLPDSRDSLPPVAMDTGRRQISGLVDNLPKPGIRVESGIDVSGWPKMVQYPEMTALSEALGERLYAYQLLMSPEAPDGFVREWTPQHLRPARNVAYAVQWFALSATVLIIYIALSFKEPEGTVSAGD